MSQNSYNHLPEYLINKLEDDNLFFNVNLSMTFFLKEVITYIDTLEDRIQKLEEKNKNND